VSQFCKVFDTVKIKEFELQRVVSKDSNFQRKQRG
jgi:hypothetical protein